MVDATPFSHTAFLGHAAAVVVAAVIALLLPLYVVSTSQAEVYSLLAGGWAGDPMAALALNTTNTSDYPMVLWACLLVAAGAAVLCVTALVQKKAPASLWGALAALAWAPVVVACLFLAADGFPMPAFTGAIPEIEVTITAGWGASLWALVVVGCAALGGTVAMSRIPAARPDEVRKRGQFLEGPAFHKLQAELVIRQSYGGQGAEQPEKSTR